MLKHERVRVNNSNFILKISTKKNRFYYSALQDSSSNVGPIDVLTSYGGCQPCTTIQDTFNYAQQSMNTKIHHYLRKLSMNLFVVLQFDTSESQKIMILANPRGEFRPRTQNECKFTAHYLRCESNSSHEYPTTSVCFIEIQLTKNKKNLDSLISDSSTMGTTIDEKHHRSHSLCLRWKTT